MPTKTSLLPVESASRVLDGFRQFPVAITTIYGETHKRSDLVSAWCERYFGADSAVAWQPHVQTCTGQQPSRLLGMGQTFRSGRQLGHERGDVDEDPSPPRFAVVELPKADAVELELLARGGEAEEISVVRPRAVMPTHDPIIGGELVVHVDAESVQPRVGRLHHGYVTVDTNDRLGSSLVELDVRMHEVVVVGEVVAVLGLGPCSVDRQVLTCSHELSPPPLVDCLRRHNAIAIQPKGALKCDSDRVALDFPLSRSDAGCS